MAYLVRVQKTVSSVFESGPAKDKWDQMILDGKLIECNTVEVSEGTFIDEMTWVDEDAWIEYASSFDDERPAMPSGAMVVVIERRAL